MLPAIKKLVQQVQNVFKKINTKTMTNELHQAVNFMKKKILDLKNSSNNNEIAIKINNKNAQNQITQLEKKIDSLQKKTTGRQNSSNELKDSFSKMSIIGQSFSKVTQRITTHIKGMGAGLKSGIGHVLNYASSLFSLQNIYSILSSSANNWLSSQNVGAKQLSDNIDYLKNSLGSVLVPIIQGIINLIYNMMKAVQSVVYALFRVNIFANSSSKAYSAMGNSAKNTKNETKQLSGMYDEINNTSYNDNSNSQDEGNEGFVSGFDLTGIDDQMSPLAQKMYDFFKPLKESWDNYGSALVEQIKTTAGQIGVLISSVWVSFENIITNGIVYNILENILKIIGNIAEAFSNAWKNNGNGDAIVQNLANAFNKLLIAVNNVVQRKEFQDWLNKCSDKFRVISEKIAEIDWQPLIDALTSIGQNVGTIALNILNGLVDVFKWLVENPVLSEIILGIAIAIGVLSAAYSIWATVTGILTGVSAALDAAILPLIAVIAGIIAVIALIVVAIINWDSIMNWLKQTVEIVINAIVEFFTNLWNLVSFIFEAIWEVISTTLGFIWNLVETVLETIWNIVSPIINSIWTLISTVFQAIWNILSTILMSIWNIFSQVFNWIWQLISQVFQGVWNIISLVINRIWENIKFVLGKIQEIWSNVWETIATVVNNVWNRIWSGIKIVINYVLEGIEKFVNGTIQGINKLLSGISRVANAVGYLIGLDPINLQISTISLPRLAKGGVLTEATAVIAGEYSGAKTNPEIVTPQNIMRDTFEEVLSSYSGNNNDKPIYLTVNVGNMKLGQILLDDLRDRKRRTGKDIEALVGG